MVNKPGSRSAEPLWATSRWIGTERRSNPRRKSNKSGDWAKINEHQAFNLAQLRKTVVANSNVNKIK